MQIALYFQPLGNSPRSRQAQLTSMREPFYVAGCGTGAIRIASWLLHRGLPGPECELSSNMGPALHAYYYLYLPPCDTPRWWTVATTPCSAD